MIEADDEVDGAVPFARAYDFFKHMTGIALVSIGGVFAFLGDAAGTRLDRRQVIITLVFIGLSGVTSLMMATTLAALEVKPVPHATMATRIRIGQSAATFLLAVGLGVFVPTFAQAILK